MPFYLVPKENDTYDQCGDFSSSKYVLVGDSQSRMMMEGDRRAGINGWRDPDTIITLRVPDYFVFTDRGAPLIRVTERLQSLVHQHDLKNNVLSNQCLVLMVGTNDLGMYIWPARWKKERETQGRRAVAIPPISEVVDQFAHRLQATLQNIFLLYGYIVVIGLPVIPWTHGRERNVEEACIKANERMEQVCSTFREAQMYPVSYLSMAQMPKRRDGIHFEFTADFHSRIEQCVFDMQGVRQQRMESTSTLLDQVRGFVERGESAPVEIAGHLVTPELAVALPLISMIAPIDPSVIEAALAAAAEHRMHHPVPDDAKKSADPFPSENEPGVPDGGAEEEDVPGNSVPVHVATGRSKQTLKNAAYKKRRREREWEEKNSKRGLPPD